MGDNLDKERLIGELSWELHPRKGREESKIINEKLGCDIDSGKFLADSMGIQKLNGALQSCGSLDKDTRIFHSSPLNDKFLWDVYRLNTAKAILKRAER